MQSSTNVLREHSDEFISKFIELLENETSQIAISWIKKRLDKNKTYLENFEDLIYLIMTTRITFSIRSTHISFYNQQILEFPISSLSQECATYINFLIENGKYFFKLMKPNGFATPLFSSFAFDDKINESNVRIKFICRLIVLIFLHDKDSGHEKSTESINIVIKNIIQRIENDHAKSKINNSINSPLAERHLHVQGSLSTLGHLMTITESPSTFRNFIENTTTPKIDFSTKTQHIIIESKEEL